MKATLQLSGWASGIDARSISTDAAAAANRAYLDFLACTLAGAATEPARRVRDAMLEFRDGSGDATVIAADRRVPSPIAAFLNAHACHVLEFDDLHGPSIYHPGAPTIAAALAVAEREAASGERLLLAIVAGYEIGIRLGEAAGTDHYSRFHTTGTVGTIGAAVAVGSILGLGQEEMADAIGTAVTQAAGLWAFMGDRADSKPLHPAHAAMMGIIAAQLAAAGVKGARSGLEGPRGFLATLGGNRSGESLCRGLGQQPERITELTLKAYPCCGHTHAGIEAAAAIHAELIKINATAAEISEIEVITYASAVAIAGLAAPQTAPEATFSYAHIVAWMLQSGTLEGAFLPEALGNQPVQQLAARVSLRSDESFDRAYPASQPVRIAVRLADGRRLEAWRDHATGSPTSPMSEAAHAAKVAQLVGNDAERWMSHARDLPRAPRVVLPEGRR